MEAKILQRVDFLKEIDNIVYRPQDDMEAMQLGYKGVRDMYKKQNAPFSKYFIIYDEKPICSIELRRDGHLIFFISKDIDKPISLIKILRELAQIYYEKCGVLFTNTANWYKEAQGLNRLIGFKPYREKNKFSLWIYDGR